MDIIDMKDYTCCITGHRTIPEDRVNHVRDEIQKEVLQAVEFVKNFYCTIQQDVIKLYSELIFKYPHCDRQRSSYSIHRSLVIVLKSY